MFDNRKIKYLRKLPEGNNIVLIWVMLLTIAGRCNAGGMIFLTENIPYTPNMLAEELGFDVNTVQLAIASLEKLGMITCDESDFFISGWAEYQNVDGMERAKQMNRERQKRWYEKQKLLSNANPNVSLTQSNAIEEDIERRKKIEKEDSEIKNNTNCPEPQASPVLTMLLNDGTEYGFDQEYIDQMQSLYPAVNVLQEMREMKAWCINNPDRRKTRKGIKKFVNNWLSKEQDKGKTQTTGGRAKVTFMDVYERKQNDR